MPATEQTWRNQKLMHRIFAVSCVILLGSTVWMFLADHNREWKKTQRVFRQAELILNQMRQLQYDTDLAIQQHDKLSAALLQAQSKPVDMALLAAFEAELKNGEDNIDFKEINDIANELNRLAEIAAAARKKADESHAKARRAAVDALAAQAAKQQAQLAIAKAAPADREKAQEEAKSKNERATQLKSDAENLRTEADTNEKLAQDAEIDAKQQRSSLIDELRAVIAIARVRENNALQTRKFRNAKLDAAKAEVGLAVRDNRSEAVRHRLQANVDELSAETVELTAKYDAASAHRKALAAILNKITDEVDELQKQVDDNQADLKRLETAHTQRRSTYFVGNFPWLGKKWLELPILDAFSSPLKIDNLWDEENKIDYNFSRVRRFDRCTTCHQAMQKTMPGSAVEPAFVKEKQLDFILASPAENELPQDADGKTLSLTPGDLERVFGIRLAGEDQYLFDRNDAMISFVQPFSPEAQPAPARLRVAGDFFPLKAATFFETETTAGTKKHGFVVGAKAADVVATVNQTSTESGISASVDDEEVQLRSVATGADAFVVVRLIGPFQYNLSGSRAKGKDPAKKEEPGEAAKLTVNKSAFPLASDVTITIRGTAGEGQVDLKKATQVNQVVERINAASRLTGVTAGEADGSLQLTSKDAGSKTFIEVEVPGESGNAALTDALSDVRAQGVNAPSSLAAEAILAPLNGGGKLVNGQKLREMALQPEHSRHAEVEVAAGAFPLGERLDIRISGPKGTREFSFAQDVTLHNIVETINSPGEETGVQAEGRDILVRLRPTGNATNTILKFEVDQKNSGGSFKDELAESPNEMAVAAKVFPLSADLDVRLTIEVQKNDGVTSTREVSFSFAKGATLRSFVDEINRVNKDKDIGVVAEESGVLKLRSTKSGEDAFVKVEVVRERIGGKFKAGLSKSLDVVRVAPDVTSGLMVGDVIEQVNGDEVRNPSHAVQLLLTGRQKGDWGEPIRLRVRRGLPNPYTSHPRLDLFVGSLSPHKMSVFACTICHEGQGSATAFKWASHTPSSTEQMEQWTHDHGWFDNPHWIFPMNPQRFAESGCLKCHHEVTELEPSERFPDPPAPKVVRGYNLIRKYGCYGCHEINGYDKPTERVGPDLRTEPNFFAVGQQLKVDAGFEAMTSAEKGWIDQLIDHPERDGLRHELYAMLIADQKKADAKAKREKEGLKIRPSDEPRFSDDARKRLAPLLKDVESPGKQRRAGPSLRYVSKKLTEEFMLDWIREPKHFRPTTRMPQFFGLRKHLEEHIHEQAAEAAEQLSSANITGMSEANKEKLSELAESVFKHTDDADRHALRNLVLAHTTAQSSNSSENNQAQQDELNRLTKLANQLVDDSERFESIEILAIATYLLRRSLNQPFEYSDPPEGIDESMNEAQVERGKELFQQRGCLACHNHSAFEGVKGYRPPGEIVQGPDLSGVSAKFAHANGRKWLYSWLKNPSRYHARTFMPNLFLEPIKQKGADGKITTTDPAADIVEFMIASSKSEWSPRKDNLSLAGLNEDAVARGTLDELVLLNLKDQASERKAKQWRAEGIPEEMRSELKGAEIELVGEGMNLDKKLMYIGRKSLAKYGCYGCHDVPGFEDAKPIGTGLADWGRKDPSKLAFEHITHYLGLPKHHEGMDFYEEALLAGHRAGFIQQKLREPRSYDYHKTENKKYNERLRMPQFPFDDDERDAIITFVLGLVADPPANKFVYQPDARSLAINEGRQVLEKYNCGGCHILEYEKWNIAYDPGTFEPADIPTFPFIKGRFSPDELAASAKQDRQGLLRATLVGLPALDSQINRDGLPLIDGMLDGAIEVVDPKTDFNTSSLIYYFDLYKPVALDGGIRQVSTPALKVPTKMLEKRYPTDGGVLAKYLLPHLINLQKKLNPGEQPKIKDTWEWGPPPLVGEGRKVQSEWLHDFLLDPHMIRPKVVLRMPKFNMSPDEATKLVNYFAAVDNAKYPYEFSTRTRSDHVAKAESEYSSASGGTQSGSRFDHAMKIVTDKKNGCTQCHIVGDFSEAPKGPDLALVYKRLRPDYVRKWIGYPPATLPYTSMPENVKYRPGDKKEDGFVVKHLHGNSEMQLDAMVDLLMNFDKFWLKQKSVKEMVDASAPAAGADETTTAKPAEKGGSP